MAQRFLEAAARGLDFLAISDHNVKLPHDYHYQREFLDASHKLDKLRLPRNFRICK